jgi:hypothetical protein
MSEDMIIPFSGDTRNPWEYPDAFSAWVRKRLGIYGKQDEEVLIHQSCIAIASSLGQIATEITEGFIDDSGTWDPDGNDDIIRVSAGGVVMAIISICHLLGYNPFVALENHFDTYLKRENFFHRDHFDRIRRDRNHHVDSHRSFWADVHGMYTSAAGHLLSISCAVHVQQMEGRDINPQGVAEIALRGLSDLTQVLGYFGIHISTCVEHMIKETYGDHEQGTEDDDGQG